jgi:hypothetical protein
MLAILLLSDPGYLVHVWYISSYIYEQITVTAVTDPDHFSDYV